MKKERFEAKLRKVLKGEKIYIKPLESIATIDFLYELYEESYNNIKVKQFIKIITGQTGEATCAELIK